MGSLACTLLCEKQRPVAFLSDMHMGTTKAENSLNASRPQLLILFSQLFSGPSFQSHDITTGDVLARLAVKLVEELSNFVPSLAVTACPRGCAGRTGQRELPIVLWLEGQRVTKSAERQYRDHLSLLRSGLQAGLLQCRGGLCRDIVFNSRPLPLSSLDKKYYGPFYLYRFDICHGTGIATANIHLNFAFRLLPLHL